MHHGAALVNGGLNQVARRKFARQGGFGPPPLLARLVHGVEVSGVRFATSEPPWTWGGFTAALFVCAIFVRWRGHFYNRGKTSAEHLKVQR